MVTHLEEFLKLLKIIYSQIPNHYILWLLNYIPLNRTQLTENPIIHLENNGKKTTYLHYL